MKASCRIARKGIPFWDRVDKMDGPIIDPKLGQCWMWMCSVSVSGYGCLIYDGKMERAHRVSAMLSGINVTDVVVLHLCNNKLCVRPSHLAAGTQKDNMEQASIQGRMCRGSRSPNSKLTEQDVIAIIKEYALGLITQSELAKRYGICRKQVCRIIHGKKWAHVHPNV